MHARRAQPQHERILGWRDVEQTLKFEAEGSLRVGGAVLRGMGDDLLPEVERIVFILPLFFAAKVRDRRPKESLFGEEVFGTRCRVVRQQARGGFADKWNQAALRNPCEKALEIFLLVGEKLSPFKLSGAKCSISIAVHP